ncbi:sulfotransferase family 2 domain-containing protein [Poseidonocella sedimentorum]|uniref:LPS sulfotransferase NodH n=1 Tax=Poseidonocella sedimentorum TaxID=871652 RepID=A0A1I6D4F4_9RHOB|nr:sulfotransferase family 2 domain-containing protein [Poseidonocella sedimentorum]SFR00192.1 hypothetical protein SAMN04515673_102106 [Poseidonocella sedimentorum]
MRKAFEYFVLFADMRTGSNFLEANLNGFDGLTSHGEAFNPQFIGAPGRGELLGISRAARDADPLTLLAAIRNRPGEIAGFRYFHDHDPRVLEPVLDDARCAKIVLTRSPVESYVSLKIAEQTGQWRLTQVSQRKAGRIRFDAGEFERQRAAQAGFHAELLRGLKLRGQTAFHIRYDELHDIDVINGLARFLGVATPRTALDRKTKIQNPGPLSDKVENPAEMEAALARYDWFDLDQRPDFETERSAAVRDYVVSEGAGLVFMPVRSGPEESVRRWLAAMDGAPLREGLSQKELRQWKRQRAGHRSFTVLRHPVARAYRAFHQRLLPGGPESAETMIENLREHHGIPLVDGLRGGADPERLRAAFLAFLGWLPEALNGQTALRPDAHWASQSRLLQGFARFAPPDAILREDDLPEALPQLARTTGQTAPEWSPTDGESAVAQGLAAIYDSDIERAVRAAYPRDFMMFGFGPWRA